MSLPFVYVREGAQNSRWARLVPILEKLFEVKFCFSNESSGISDVTLMKRWVDGQRFDDVTSSLEIASPHILAKKGEPREISVRFTNDPEVPFPFRARSVRSKVGCEPKVLSLSSDEIVLAENENGPVWAVAEKGGVKRFRCGFALPELGPHEHLKSVLNENRFVELIPLLHWLRLICADDAYEMPQLRACFIFDDPNLHWHRYGFIDFHEIAMRAALENYHVSFATIPLDAWFAHQGTVHLFRSNPARLSLSVHGNNHTRQELARAYTRAERSHLLNGARTRIEQFEGRTGLPVSRVMIPPHGACSEEMLEDLPCNGFEAASISHGSLSAHNPEKPWVKHIGYAPSESINGCPVLPRWSMTGNNANVILLAAFLHQPILLRGHHQDLKQGVELLDGLARMVNDLGTVTWCNLSAISRMNCVWRMDGATCRVKPRSPRVFVRLPRGADRLVVEESAGANARKWLITCQGGTASIVSSGEECVAQEGEYSIETIVPPPKFFGKQPLGLLASAVLRRLLTEGRDRLQPVLSNR